VLAITGATIFRPSMISAGEVDRAEPIAWSLEGSERGVVMPARLADSLNYPIG
jgi:hypothetical protein